MQNEITSEYLSSQEFLKSQDRFWDKVFIPEKAESGCWTWTTKLNQGYGMLGLPRLEGNWKSWMRFRSHQISWMIHFGLIPEGVCVMHICDNRACVRPDHLILGTRADNNHDRNNKGREGDRAGEKNGRHKVTWKDVREMRSLRGVDTNALAFHFGISRITVNQILRGFTWKE